MIDKELTKEQSELFLKAYQDFHYKDDDDFKKLSNADRPFYDSKGNFLNYDKALEHYRADFWRSFFTDTFSQISEKLNQDILPVLLKIEFEKHLENKLNSKGQDYSGFDEKFFFDPRHNPNSANNLKIALIKLDVDDPTVCGAIIMEMVDLVKDKPFIMKQYQELIKEVLFGVDRHDQVDPNAVFFDALIKPSFNYQSIVNFCKFFDPMLRSDLAVDGNAAKYNHRALSFFIHNIFNEKDSDLGEIFNLLDKEPSETRLVIEKFLYTSLLGTDTIIYDDAGNITLSGDDIKKLPKSLDGSNKNAEIFIKRAIILPTFLDTLSTYETEDAATYDKMIEIRDEIKIDQGDLAKFITNIKDINTNTLKMLTSGQSQNNAGDISKALLNSVKHDNIQAMKNFLDSNEYYQKNLRISSKNLSSVTDEFARILASLASTFELELTADNISKILPIINQRLEEIKAHKGEGFDLAFKKIHSSTEDKAEILREEFHLLNCEEGSFDKFTLEYVENFTKEIDDYFIQHSYITKAILGKLYQDYQAQPLYNDGDKNKNPLREKYKIAYNNIINITKIDSNRIDFYFDDNETWLLISNPEFATRKFFQADAIKSFNKDELSEYLLKTCDIETIAIMNKIVAEHTKHEARWPLTKIIMYFVDMITDLSISERDKAAIEVSTDQVAKGLKTFATRVEESKSSPGMQK